MWLIKSLGWASFTVMSIMAVGLAVQGLAVASLVVFLCSFSAIPGVVDWALRGRVARLTSPRRAIALVLSWLVTIFVFAVAVPDAPSEVTVAEDVPSSGEVDAVEPLETGVARNDDAPTSARASVDPQPTQPSTNVDLIYAEEVRLKALTLWRELEAVRYDENFHRYGLGAGGPMHSWHQRREALYNEWTDYLQTLPVGERFSVALGSPIAFMYSIAKDWAFTGGMGKASTDPMIEEVEQVIVGGDLSASADF